MPTFGTLPDGRTASLHSLTNANGLSVEVTNYGGIITRLLAPDRDGRLADVVLGFDSLEPYVADSPFFGALIGRVGNRIAHGRFPLDGRVIDLPSKNNAPAGIPCHLHGGALGFDKVLWEIEPVSRDGANGLRLTYVSRDGEEGYPGTLTATVHYWLTADNALHIDYLATTDQPTPVNLTQHTYFNLRGHDAGDILGHVLQINASQFTPSNAGQIPTGEIVPVAHTPFDFTRPKPIGADIGVPDTQLGFAGGYDHNFVLDRAGPGLVLAATVHEPVSRRYLEVFTEEPGVQFYCGNFLDGHHIGKGGCAYARRSGFCLETQHFPDAPNHANFPSIILRPGQVYRTSTIYRFSTR